jgi:hypothetical protein
MSISISGSQGSAGRQPGTPTIGTASTSSPATATVPFTAPSYLGKPIGTSYIATSNPGGITGTSETSPITVTGLTNGTGYTFTVKLNNGVIDSLSSAESNSVTPNASTPPFFPVFGPFFPPSFPPTCNPPTGTVCATVPDPGAPGQCVLVSVINSNCDCVYAYTECF